MPEHLTHTPLMVLKQEKGFGLFRDPSGRLYYNYDASGVGFLFSLLSEVGAPFQYWFRDALTELGITPRIVETVNDYFESI